MPASSGTQTLLDLLMRDPNAGGARGMPQPGAAPPPTFTGPGNAPTGGSQVSSAGGYPYQGDPYNYAGTPAGDPSNWRLMRADAQSPLAYMGLYSDSPYAPGGWQPNDKGGYFTLDQLYQGRGVPNQGMQVGSDRPSTNNWQLTIPFGGGPGAIMRNGMVIFPSEVAGYGNVSGHSGSAGGGGADTSMTFNSNVAPFGPNIWGYKFWPGGQPYGGGGQGNYLT